MPVVSYFDQNSPLSLLDTCWNCMKCNNGSTVKLSRCKCKLAFYCSTLCQKEHWIINHKKYCKVLSGAERRDGTEHDFRKCRTCKDMARKPHKYRYEAGSMVGCPYKDMEDAVKTMSRLLVHHIGRNWKSDYAMAERRNGQIVFLDYNGDEIVGAFDLPPNLEVNLPLELGELTGKYVDKIDKALGEMITLAATVDLSACEVDGWILRLELIKVRTFYWACILARNLQYFIFWFSDVDPLWGHLHLINSFMIQQNFPSKSWMLLVLKYDYIRAQEVLFHHKQMVKSGSSSEFVQHTQSMFEALGDLEILDVKENCKVWKDFYEIMNLLFYRQNDLLGLEVLSLETQEASSYKVKCSSCSLQIYMYDAQFRPDVFLNKNLLGASSTWSGPTIVVHQWSFATFVCCGASTCIEKVRDLYNEESIKWKPSSELVNGFQCDSCSLFVIKPHRCSKCMSKQYCSPECQALDWRVVHMKMCKEYEKKGGRTFNTKERKELLFEMQAQRDFS